MAENQNFISNPVAGMIIDRSSLSLKETNYTYAQNATVLTNSQEGEELTIQNDGSNLLAINFPSGYIVIGRKSVPEQNRTLFFSVNPTTGHSQIGEVLDCIYNDDSDDTLAFSACDHCEFEERRLKNPLEQITQTPYCTYTSIVDNTCLNFSIDNPVRSQYKITDCQFNLYFTDDLNQRRFLYFDYTDTNHLSIQQQFKVVTGYEDDECEQPIYSDELDCNKINYHPKFEIPEIKQNRVITGGELQAGVKQVLLAYTDKEGHPLTEYFPASNPIPIFSRQITFETNYKTNKAILIDVDKLDQTSLYSYYNVVIADTVDNFTEFKLLGTFPTTQHSVLYTGANEQDLPRLTADDIFIKKVYFKRAGNITSANEILFFSNITEWSKPNLQRVANNVKLWWQTVAAPEHLVDDPRFTTLFRGYQRDEVYSFGIEFISDVGEVLGSYHIPGPSKGYFMDTYGIDVDQVVTNEDAVTLDACLDCCEDAPIGTAIKGKVSTGCSDKGCSQQGLTELYITFDNPTTEALTLYIGEVHVAQTGTFAWGEQIFTPPPGATTGTYYPPPAGRPFVVNIPAGTTSFATTNIPVKDPVFGVDYGGSWDGSKWVCHNCLFPITDLYIKTVVPTSTQCEFTTTQPGLTVHNIASDVQPPTGGGDDCDDCSVHYWQIYNTGLVVGTPHEVLDDCSDDRVWEWGEFGYWQSTRRYPNDPEIWGELCGKPIRHHKFPDSLVTHIHDGKDISKTYTDNNIIYPIGVRVDHQSVINALTDAVTEGLIREEDRARITQYRIIRGNRVGHKSIIAKGLLFDMWSYNKYSNTYYYPNYPFNSLQQDKFISNDPNTYKGGNNSSPIPNTFTQTGRYTFHSPDTEFAQPGIGSIIKLETVEYGQSEGYFNHCEEQAKHKLLSTAAVSLTVAAGIAAAFSAQREKECTTYTIRSTSEEVDTSVTAGVRTTTWSNLPFTRYQKDTGLPIIPVVDPGAVGLGVDSYTKTTCKGTTYQLLDPLYWIANPGPGAIAAGINILNQAIYLAVLSIHEIKIIQDLVQALIPLKNLHIQYNSVGKYNSYKTIANAGKKIRDIKRSAYLEPSIQLINEAIDTAAGQFTNIHVNNWNRERSVYLKISNTRLLPNPVITDTSRVTLNDAGLDQGDLNKRIYRTISSYYGTVKNFVADQYGSINNVNYLPTGPKTYELNIDYTISQTGVFGGDTFISRYALKRKLPFYIQSRFRQLNEADVQYSDLGNVGYPNYYFNTPEPLMERIGGNTFGGSLGTVITDLLGVPESRLDAKKQKFFYQSGFVHLYSYGIPYFFVESDVNCSYRHGENAVEKDFYPHQRDLDFWLQEKNVPITEPNYFFYNTTYSKQNHEHITLPQVSEIIKDCNITFPSDVIQSQGETSNQSEVDQWLIFKANDRKSFPARNGRIIGLDGIENDKVLTRFENTSQIFGAYNVLKTDVNDIQVGNGSMFNSNPKEFASTTLGYMGSQNSELLQTEFGHVWVDAKRGQVFLIAPNATGVKELAGEGMKNWFRENLPFQVLKDFTNMPLEDIDNSYKGLGITMSFDKRYSRVLITKLDYKKLKSGITYDNDTKLFMFNSEEVSLNDKEYFCNKSWTTSYSFLTNSWVSFHSFTPNYYVDHIDYNQSGINSTQSSLWSHNVSNKTYQVYYGKIQPFSVEIISVPLMLNGVLNSIEYVSEAIRFHNLYDNTTNRLVTFNKAIIYNDQQCSGELTLNVRDENNMAQMIEYPKVDNNSQHILVTRDREVWRFNQFWDTVNSQTANLPFLINKCNNCEKELNVKALNYYKPDMSKTKIKGKQTKIRLIQDKDSQHNYRLYLTNQHKESY